MSSGKGGKADAGPMLQYGNKALELQRQQYEEGKKISQPWVTAGTAGINRLSELMGLSGGGTETRDSIYNRLLPQYTTQTAAPAPQSNYYIGKGGQMIDGSNQQAVMDYVAKNSGREGANPLKYTGYSYDNFLKNPSKFGLTAFQPVPQRTSNVDTARLNAEVDRLYGAQQPVSGFGSLLETFKGQDIYTDPSYQFRLGQGQKAMERQLAASGKYLTPQASQALMELGQNMGSQEYQNAYNRFNQDQGNLYNRLAGISGVGQQQVNNIIGAGQNYANQAGELYTGMGNAITSAQQANAARKQSMFNTLLSTGAQLGSAYMLSDERLKTKIKKIGEENGHDIYEFAYKSDPNKMFIGVMAQDVQKKNPDAVEEINGYLAVDYDKIGVNFREA